MATRKAVIIAAAAASSLGLLLQSQASAAPPIPPPVGVFHCATGPAPLVGATIHGDVEVTSGDTCSLAGATTITGSVHVMPNGNLRLGNQTNLGSPGLTLMGNLDSQPGATVDVGYWTNIAGSVHLKGARWVVIHSYSTVGKDIDITGTTSIPALEGWNLICGTAAGGVQLHGNSARFSIGDRFVYYNEVNQGCIFSNTVSHHLTLDGNSGYLDVVGNNVAQDIDATNNTGGLNLDGNHAGGHIHLDHDTSPVWVVDNTATRGPLSVDHSGSPTQTLIVQGNTVGGNLNIDHSTGAVLLVGNTVGATCDARHAGGSTLSVSNTAAVFRDDCVPGSHPPG